MADKVMVIFTAKSVEACLEVGGSQSWVLDRANARGCEYAVLCRNAHTDWGDGDEPHGTAFMLGHISDVVPSTETEGRWLVKFDKYARLNIPKFWQGWRNPIRYTTLEELPLSLDNVDFKPMPEISENPIVPSHLSGLTIAEAKKGLSIKFCVPEEAIEIIIHG